MIGYVSRLLVDKISNASGNNLIGEFPLLESSVLNYDESLPMSSTCVQSVKTLTKRVYILTIALRANIVMQLDYSIHSYQRTTVTRNCCAPGRIDYAPTVT